MFSLSKRGVSPVIAIVLLLMMTVAAAGAAYFWLTRMQSGIQEQSTKSIENIMQKSGRRLIAQAAICEPTAPEGMVDWYEFEETNGKNGSAVLDSSENNNKGILHLNSTTQDATADGKVGKALKFDGSDDYIEVPDSASLDITNEITLSAWIYTRSYPGNQVFLISKHPNYNLMMANNYLAFYYINESGDAQDYRSNNDVTKTGEWQHFVAVSTFTSVTLYVDRKEVPGHWQYGSGTGNPRTTINTLDVGKRTTGGKNHDGLIDEVRIYDRALSAEEINETYKGKMKVKVTVRNIGSVEIPKAKFVANLKKDGTTVDSDTYVTESSIDTGDLKTLTFYFNEMRPGGEGYMISIPGIDVSQSVSCQSLE